MIKVYVMATCPDCSQVKLVAEGDPRFNLIDIGAQARNLKEFLRLRDSHPKFATARRLGLIGIPAFLFEDGSVSFKACEAGLNLASPSSTSSALDTIASTEPDGPACNIDGSGC